jgi:sugar phosphate isomerase/epimerase
VLAAIKGHKNLGACADLGHWARSGLNPVDCLKKLEGHLIGAHLKDIVEFNQQRARDTVVGKGVLDFPPIFQEFKRQNFKGMFSVEHESNWYHNMPGVKEAVRFYYDQVAKLK